MPRPHFTAGKDTVPTVQEAGWAPGRSGQVRRIWPPPGFDPRIVLPVIRRYTDYTTRPVEYMYDIISLLQGTRT